MSTSTTSAKCLVATIPDGPVDIVGDIHGEIDALRDLLSRLGYSENGDHPQQRRLIFVGDLIDRGPDSPAVVQLVRHLVESGQAQCLLGNHELNLLCKRRKPDNAWFYGVQSADGERLLTSDAEREGILDFIRSCPLALERSDLRAVHACWDPASIELARQHDDVAALFEEHAVRIKAQLQCEGVTDEVEHYLRHRCQNPVRLLTAGPYHRLDEPFNGSKGLKHADRTRWWNQYADQVMCVFGHYGRIPLIGDDEWPPTFAGTQDLYAPLGIGSCLCIDFTVSGRAIERREGHLKNSAYHLAALRWPENTLMHDEDTILPVLNHPTLENIRAH